MGFKKQIIVYAKNQTSINYNSKTTDPIDLRPWPIDLRVLIYYKDTFKLKKFKKKNSDFGAS